MYKLKLPIYLFGAASVFFGVAAFAYFMAHQFDRAIYNLVLFAVVLGVFLVILIRRRRGDAKEDK